MGIPHCLTKAFRSAESGYLCRKVLVGEGRCFQRVEVALRFDQNRALVEHQVNSGEFLQLSA